MQTSEHEPVQLCRLCGETYRGLGEACRSCRNKCTCRWDLGMGPNMRCRCTGAPPREVRGHEQD